MRIGITISLIFLLFWNVKGQTNFNSPGLNSGVYRSFDEFITNSPSMLLDSSKMFVDEDILQVVANVTGFIVYQGNPISLSIFHLREKYSRKRINVKEYWGFSDGTHVYINSYTHMPKQHFVKLLLIGRYCYFLQLGENDYSPVGPGQLFSFKDIDEYIINVNNGNIYKLDRKLLRVILEKDGELLNEFNNDKNVKKKLLIDYIDRYNQRHVDEIKVLHRIGTQG